MKVLRFLGLFGILGICGTFGVHGQAQEPLKLEVLLVKQEMVSGFEKLCREFEKENPGILIETLLIPNDDNRTLMTRAVAQRLPEIMQFYSGETLDTFMKSGHLADLSQEPLVNQVQDTFLTEGSYQGKVMALPTDFFGIGILYNKKIFKKLGLTPPRTFTELKSVAKSLKSKGLIPFAGLLRENWALGHFLTLIHSGLLEAAGGPGAGARFLTAMNQGKTSYGAGLDRLFEIYDFFLAHLGPNASDMSWDDQQRQFGREEAAMMVQGLWSYGSLRGAYPQVEVGFIPFPLTDKPEDSRFYALADSYLGIYAHASKEKQAAAKKFFTWIASPSGARRWTELVPTTTFKSTTPPKDQGEPYQALYNGVLTAGRIPVSFFGYPLQTWEQAVKESAWGYAHKKLTKEEVIRAIDESWAQEIRKAQK